MPLPFSQPSTTFIGARIDAVARLSCATMWRSSRLLGGAQLPIRQGLNLCWTREKRKAACLDIGPVHWEEGEENWGARILVKEAKLRLLCRGCWPVNPE